MWRCVVDTGVVSATLLFGVALIALIGPGCCGAPFPERMEVEWPCGESIQEQVLPGGGAMPVPGARSSRPW